MAIDAPKRIWFDENGAFASETKGYPEEVAYIRADIAEQWLMVLRKTRLPIAWISEKHPEFDRLYDEINKTIQKARDF